MRIVSTDENSAKNCPDEQAQIIQESRYTLDQLFNAEEMSLLWKQIKAT